MTSNSGFTSQHIDYPQAIQEVFDHLHQMQRKPTLATSPQDLEALERDIRQHTDHLGSLLVGHHLQHSLAADALQAEQDQLVSQWPKPLKNDGRVKVWVHTAIAWPDAEWWSAVMGVGFDCENPNVAPRPRKAAGVTPEPGANPRC